MESLDPQGMGHVVSINTSRWNCFPVKLISRVGTGSGQIVVSDQFGPFSESESFKSVLDSSDLKRVFLLLFFKKNTSLNSSHSKHF